MTVESQNSAALVRKRHGVHYTPPELASFLANATVQALGATAGRLRVLDPACGDGGLLHAFAAALEPTVRARTTLVAYETDATPLANAESSLARCGVAGVSLHHADFLTIDDTLCQTFDAVIVNPPYVRTQVLGARRSQLLAKRFGLTGRVDLSYAFVRAITEVLCPGGVLGLLTSNRFLSVRAGAATRELLRTEFETEAVYDLGDTRLFTAAVLPAIVIAKRRRERGIGRAGEGEGREGCHVVREEAAPTFDRVYKCDATVAGGINCESLLGAVSDRTVKGLAETPQGRFRIERGMLAASANASDVWRMAQPASDQWLTRLRKASPISFGDVATIRVGIKTTADAVFVRDDWHQLAASLQPEPELLHPLITHREATRWSITPTERPRQVLYPHVSRSGKRVPIELEDFPRAAAYLRTHEERLNSRRYVTDAGRRWYEIWVAHDPAAWAQPKIVFPDIAEAPRFSLDTSGAIVQGDCYWITLKPGADPRWLPLMLAVANSNVATKFYDLCFHNKLYAGRRRYMTQYVEQFPLPSADQCASLKIVGRVESLASMTFSEATAERELESLVDKAFGLDS